MKMNTNMQYEEYVQIYTITARWIQDEILIFINEHYNEDRKMARPSAKSDDDFDSVRIFYTRMCHRYPELMNRQHISKCLNGNTVFIGHLFDRLFKSIIVQKITSKYSAHEQDEAIEKLMSKTQELFPACFNMMKPIYEFNFDHLNPINIISINETLGVYKELYQWLINYEV